MVTQVAQNDLLEAARKTDLATVRAALHAHTEDQLFVKDAYTAVSRHLRELEHMERLSQVQYVVAVKGWVQLPKDAVQEDKEDMLPQLATGQYRQRDKARLATRLPGSTTYGAVTSLLQNTWTERDACEFKSVELVQEVLHPHLQQRFENYKARLPSEFRSSEQLCFHGCTSAACERTVNCGLTLERWHETTERGIFGTGIFGQTGIYFACQSSRAMMTEEVQGLGQGLHTGTLVLFKVATGQVAKTRSAVDQVPDLHHSVYGLAGGDIPFDQLVVYDDAAVLPYCVVRYTFLKHVNPAVNPIAAQPTWHWEDGGHESGQTGGHGQHWVPFSSDSQVAQCIETAFLLGKDKVAFSLGHSSDSHFKTFMFKVTRPQATRISVELSSPAAGMLTVGTTVEILQAVVVNSQIQVRLVCPGHRQSDDPSVWASMRTSRIGSPARFGRLSEIGNSPLGRSRVIKNGVMAGYASQSDTHYIRNLQSTDDSWQVSLSTSFERRVHRRAHEVVFECDVDGKGTWVEYSPELNSRLVAACAAGEEVLFTRSTQKYKIDFSLPESAPVQINVKTRVIRQIRPKMTANEAHHVKSSSKWAVGQTIAVDTSDGVEKNVTILGPAESGNRDEMHIRFSDGTTDDWRTSDFIDLGVDNRSLSKTPSMLNTVQRYHVQSQLPVYGTAAISDLHANLWEFQPGDVLCLYSSTDDVQASRFKYIK